MATRLAKHDWEPETDGSVKSFTVTVQAEDKRGMRVGFYVDGRPVEIIVKVTTTWTRAELETLLGGRNIRWHYTRSPA